MSSSVCPGCSTPNRCGAKFCVKCGALLIGPARLQAGQVMRGKYTIVRELGRGGMGAVYLATEIIANTQRQVVVKEMLDYYDSNDPQDEVKARKRFETEAATLVKLNLPRIPQIFDFFSEGGSNYIVMQYIPGRNLELGLTHEDQDGKWIAGQPYPISKVLQWGIQVCDVLEGLSTQNVVHMDLKPANLIVDSFDNVWLVDFGTAKPQWGTLVGQQGTQKSSVYGTAGYAPPEQRPDSQKIEPRSDVYSLAATLYHLLTDDDPRDHPFQFPRLSQFPTDLASALQRALNKDVNLRLTAGRFRLRLEQVVQPAPSPAPYLTFTWRDGTVCRNPPELVRLSEKYWSEAETYLNDGSLERWFQQLNRNDLLHAAQQSRQKHSGRPAAALDELLRILNPALPLPTPSADLQQIDFGLCDLNRPQATSLAARVQIANHGRGCLHGPVNVSEAWLSVAPSYVELLPGQVTEINVKTDHSTLGWGERRQGHVAVQTNGGQVTIPCFVRTSPLWSSQDLWANLAGFKGGFWGGLWGVVLGVPSSIVAHLGCLWAVISISGRIDWIESDWSGLIVWSALVGAVLGGWTGGWLQSLKPLQPPALLEEEWWRFGVRGGIGSSLVIGSYYVVAKLGLLVWLAIFAAHYFYHLGFIVSVPVGIVGAMIGAIWVLLVVLARKLTWFGLQGLLWALARMG